MRVQVRLYGPLTQYRPSNAPASGPFPMEVSEDATVGNVAQLLGIPQEWARSAFVNGEASALARPLLPTDLVVFAPPMGGGE